MATVLNIINQGSVYTSVRRRVRFIGFTERIQRILQGTIKENTFDALYNGLDSSTNPWETYDDVVNPFGDKRQSAGSVYTFDLDTDTLLYSEGTWNLQVPLSRARGETLLDLKQFTPFTPQSIPEINTSVILKACWNPTFPNRPCEVAFVGRLLSDFNHTWRHILRHPYKDTTFRKLARAIICLSALNFTVLELTSRQRLYATGRGPFISIYQLPLWASYDQHVLRVGRLKVILDQDLKNAIQIIRKDIDISDGQTPKDEQAAPDYGIYLVLSIRHIILCRIESDSRRISWTRPESLCNGIDKPSPAALNWLLQAFSYERRLPPQTPIHKLPIEIQDQILDYVSDGPIESARLGCVLALGSPFKWQRRKDWPRKQGAIEVLSSHTMRSEVSPVESKIFFDGTFSGLDYK